MYYKEVLDLSQRSASKMKMFMEKAMEHIRKEHLTTFTKHLLGCDPSLGLKFFRHIQIHYDMNSNPEMLTKKLQMLVSVAISNE
jgi:hypothetical protein